MKVTCTATALKIRSLPTLSPDSDTGKRMFGTQVALVYGESLDQEWLYVDAPAGRGWCSKQYLTPITVDTKNPADELVLLSPGWPKVPTGYNEIVEIFGKPGKAVCSAGRVRLPAPLKLSWADQSVRVLACHKLLEDVFTNVFDQLYHKNLWGYLKTTGGIYEPRTVTSSQKTSTHAWGIAIDLNPHENPLGAKPVMNERVILVFEDHGFVWGGNWSRPDGMHFQYAKGY